ncbi:MAG: dTMP kinase [Elusimicrobia bacterium]|nr:dTMP kinase [Elusimicrobiota bacterium]
MKKPSGFFVTLEGQDGSGKSTHAKLLVQFLKAHGYPVYHTREPGGTRLAERLRGVLLHPKGRIVSAAELLLYLAARAQHVIEVLRPRLARGETVICERFCDATLAYQGYGRGLALPRIRQLNALATDGLQPDITILLDVPTARGLARARASKRHQGRGPDRLEREATVFHRRVRQGYLTLAAQEPRRIRVIRATGSVAATQARIRALVLQGLRAHVRG